MASIFMAAAKNAMLDAVAALIDQVSVHDADPGTTGTDEISGGTYARQTVAWDAAASGEATLAAEEEFDMPAGSEALFIGLWDATGPTFLGKMDVPGGPLSFPTGGVLTLLDTTKLDINDS